MHLVTESCAPKEIGCPEHITGTLSSQRGATAALAEARRIEDTTFDAAERSFVSLLSTYTAFVAGERSDRIATFYLFIEGLHFDDGLALVVATRMT